ncbi:MAG: transposase [Candidatus Hadarchaeales archaeon]
MNLSYRQFEGASPLVLGKTIDHSTIGWAFKRLAPSYVRLLLRFLARRIEPLLQPEFFVMDSTGISTNFYSRKRGVLRWGRKKVFLKLHALVGCSLQKGALFVREASVTGEGCHDLTQVAYLLEAAEGGGRPLLADSAYDYTLAYRLARERGFRPVIKPRETEGPRGFERREMVGSFDQELYRLRKVAEGFFGAIATRYLSRIRYRLLHVQECSILLMAVGQNLRVLLRLMPSKTWRVSSHFSKSSSSWNRAGGEVWAPADLFDKPRLAERLISQ